MTFHLSGYQHEGDVSEDHIRQSTSHRRSAYDVTINRLWNRASPFFSIIAFVIAVKFSRDLNPYGERKRESKI